MRSEKRFSCLTWCQAFVLSVVAWFIWAFGWIGIFSGESEKERDKRRGKDCRDLAEQQWRHRSTMTKGA